jgi:hypothetical protein
METGHTTGRAIMCQKKVNQNVGDMKKKKESKFGKEEEEEEEEPGGSYCSRSGPQIPHI